MEESLISIVKIGFGAGASIGFIFFFSVWAGATVFKITNQM